MSVENKTSDRMCLLVMFTVNPQSNLERVMGIEPTFSAWEADVLPLNDTRKRPNKH